MTMAAMTLAAAIGRFQFEVICSRIVGATHLVQILHLSILLFSQLGSLFIRFPS